MQEDDDAVQILQINNVEIKNVLNELDTSRNEMNNNNLIKLKQPSTLNHQDLKTDKENLEHFVINRAKIEVQTVEAVQINLESVQLFTCELDENLDKDLDCFCISHDVYQKMD